MITTVIEILELGNDGYISTAKIENCDFFPSLCKISRNKVSFLFF